MSFSFRRKANSKAAIKEAAEEEMAGIVRQQPVHSSDADRVLVAVNTYIDLLADLEEGDEIVLTVSGSLGWHGDQDNREFISANLGINVALTHSAKE